MLEREREKRGFFICGFCWCQAVWHGSVDGGVRPEYVSCLLFAIKDEKIYTCSILKNMYLENMLTFASDIPYAPAALRIISENCVDTHGSDLVHYFFL